jgi:hypothetical protein
MQQWSEGGKLDTSPAGTEEDEEGDDLEDEDDMEEEEDMEDEDEEDMHHPSMSYRHIYPPQATISHANHHQHTTGPHNNNNNNMGYDQFAYPSYAYSMAPYPPNHLHNYPTHPSSSSSTTANSTGPYRAHPYPPPEHRVMDQWIPSQSVHSSQSTTAMPPYASTHPHPSHPPHPPRPRSPSAEGGEVRDNSVMKLAFLTG